MLFPHPTHALSGGIPPRSPSFFGGQAPQTPLHGSALKLYKLIMTTITETTQLANFCDQIAKAPFIAIDTEFIRDTSYYPKLCLIQISDGKNTAAIDPLAQTLTLNPLYAILNNPTITKVFHSARQDLEIFHNLTKTLPKPLFDTQIAAMACGFGDTASYQMLAKKILDIELDKSQRFSDWQRRPLTHEQIQYALSDVIHLAEIYPKLKNQIAEKNRDEWITEPMQALLNPELYEMSPETAWKRLRFTVSGKKRMGILAAAAAWREREAQRVNVPRGRILRDDILREVALRDPKDEAALENIRGVSKGFARSRAAMRLLNAIATATDMKPEKDPRKISAPPEILDMLRLLLRLQCAKHAVAPKLVASNGTLEQIAAGITENISALQGWRREIFGEEALAMMRGEICLAVQDKTIRVMENKTR